MTNHLKLTLLIANYNNGHFFNDCYKSLIAQTSTNWEAIIIDDCSTDNSVEVIKNLIQTDPRFSFYENEENLGYQKTIQKAISLTKTEIFGRVDPDDALMPQAVEKSLQTHQNFLDVGLVYSNCKICDENLNYITTNAGKQVNTDQFVFGEISHFATFKKDIYLKTSGLDVSNKRAEDQDLYMKMMEVAPVKFINEELYLYRIHNMSASTGDNLRKSHFWHWVAVIKAAERRNVNIEDFFLENFIEKKDYDDLVCKIELMKKNKWLKLGEKLGVVKFLKYF